MTKQSGAARSRRTRFETLKKRRRQHAQFLAAVERLQRRENARLATVRARLRPSGQVPGSPIKRRREEYLEPPRPQPSLRHTRATGAVAIALALPLVLALASNLVPHGTLTIAMRQAREVAPSAPSQFARPAATRVAHAPAANPPATKRLAHPKSTPQAAVATAPVARSEIVHTEIPEPTSRPGASPAASVPIQRANIPTAASHSKAPAPAHVLAMILRAIFRGVAPRSNPPETQPRVLQHAQPARPAHVAAVQRQPKFSPPFRPRPAAALRPMSPWELSADGTWTALVHAPSSMRGANFAVSTGQMIQLERSSISSDAATVTVGWARPVRVTITGSDRTALRELPAPDDSIEAFDAVARAVGPHLVNVGWTPLGAAALVSDYKIFRSTGEGERPVLISTVDASQHSLHDRDIDAVSRYRYTVVAETTNDSVQTSTATVETPAELPPASASDISGKGMFLYFSALTGDVRNFHRYNPENVIAEAQRAGIRVIELRMARGSCTMAETADAHAWLDRIIDAAARANIKLLAWTVPRRVTTQDLAETIAAAEYTTTNGNGFIGLALDLETGDNYMGSGAVAREAMVGYISAVRSAVGPRYLIVATVASPRLGYSNVNYPYARIAAYADVLQPMEYWHYFDQVSHHEYARREVAGAAKAAVARTRQLAGRDIPVDIAGQSVDLEGTGAPSGSEIRWSLDGAKSVGAIGETFFDWAGTQPDAWAAIQAFDW